jgi:hypothetical protein
MKNALKMSVAALALLAAPSHASTLIVGPGVDSTPLASNNDFATNLQGLGLTILRTNATLTLTGPSNVTVEYFGSESGFVDTFTLGTLSFAETNKNVFGAQLLGTVLNLPAGPLSASFTSNGHGNTHGPGTVNFGFFLPRGTTGVYESNEIWIGYDDQINNADDNHDDFVLRLTVTPVPEPTTWAMMIGGFGLLGATLRRRRVTTLTYA